MNLDRSPWFVRAGMLVLLVGFFMPTMLVSCSGMTSVEKSYSLSDLASQAEQPLLYLLLAGSLVAGVVSFLSYTNREGQKSMLLIQVIAVGAGLVAMLGSLLSLSNQIQEQGYGMFKVRPDYGAIFIAGGIVLFAVGWWQQWTSLDQGQMSEGGPVDTGDQDAGKGWNTRNIDGAQQFDEPTDVPNQHELPPDHSIVRPALLEPIRGVLPHEDVIVAMDNFTIGRNSDNCLVISDPEVSRYHARLRYHEGIWFIQDTESAAGILVNGKKVLAKRLKPGDKIEIINNLFLFRC